MSDHLLYIQIAAEEVRELEESLDVARDVLAQTLLAGREAGVPNQECANAAGVSPGRVSQIVRALEEDAG